MLFTYGENAVLNDVQVDGTAVDNQMQYNLENYLLDQAENNEDLIEIAVPEQVVITYGMTQKQLAEKTGISQSDISKFETGGGNPSIKTLQRLAAGMGMVLQVEFKPATGTR